MLDDPNRFDPRLTPLRDHLTPRLWHRPWQDAPGFLLGCSRCCSAPTSGPPLIPNACCAGGLPSEIHATFSNSGKCAAFDGQTVPLVFTTAPRLNYNFTSPRWEYVLVNTGSCEEVVQFFCTYDPAFSPCPGFTGCLAFRLNVPAFGANCAGASGTSSCSCSPLSIVFKNVQFLPPPPENGCTDCTNGSISPATWATVAITF